MMAKEVFPVSVFPQDLNTIPTPNYIHNSKNNQVKDLSTWF